MQGHCHRKYGILEELTQAMKKFKIILLVLGGLILSYFGAMIVRKLTQEPTPPGIILSLMTQVIDATYLEKYVTHFQLRIATFASS